METPLFDREISIQQKDMGMQQAAENKHSLLLFARKQAIQIAKEKGTVTADDVSERLYTQFSIHPESLGPASGSLFKSSDFKFMGEFVPSRRVKNHGRLLRVWGLNG